MRRVIKLVFSLILMFSLAFTFMPTKSVNAYSTKTVSNQSDEVINYVSKLENLANSYSVNTSDANKYKPSKTKWLVMMYLRSFRYNSGNWNEVGGNLDTAFVSYVDSNDPSIRTYFSSNQYFVADNKGNSCDFIHMSATLSTIMYDSSTMNSTADALAGWAGDTQTFLRNNILPSYSGSSYNDVYNATLNNMGKDNTYFSYSDLIADVDAVNVYNLLVANPNSSISDVLGTYYSANYKNRFTSFINGRSQKSLASDIKTYCNLRYLGVVTWPLYNGVSSIPSNVSSGVSDGIAAYLYNLMNEEKGSSISAISINPTVSNLNKGESAQFTTTVTMSNNTTNNNVTYSLSANSNSSINANGLLTIGNNETSSVIYVYATSNVDQSYVATATVNITAIKVNSVKINSDVTSLKQGKSASFKAVVTLNNNTTNNDVTYSVKRTDNKTCKSTIDNDGNLKVNKNEVKGNLIITATSKQDPSVSDSKTISVKTGTFTGFFVNLWNSLF